jgi:hypothetical protein
MIRTFTITDDMNEKRLLETLLDARFSGPQADAAMQKLRKLNPSANFKKLKRGTVLFVPDEPAFKAKATDRRAVTPIEEFVAMAREGLATATKDMKQGLEMRAAERAGLATIFKSGGFKKLASEDEELAQQAAESSKKLQEEEDQDNTDAQSLTKLNKSALAALDQLAKLVQQ